MNIHRFEVTEVVDGFSLLLIGNDLLVLCLSNLASDFLNFIVQQHDLIFKHRVFQI